MCVSWIWCLIFIRYVLSADIGREGGEGERGRLEEDGKGDFPGYLINGVGDRFMRF
jgi:hypothetical protein